MIKQRIFNGKRLCALPMKRSKDDSLFNEVIYTDEDGKCPQRYISCGLKNDAKHLAACVPAPDGFESSIEESQYR